MDEIRKFALEIVQSVRDHTEAHEKDSSQLTFWVSTSSDPARLVDALTHVLQYDRKRITFVIADAVQDIPAFENFPFVRRVTLLRMQHG